MFRPPARLVPVLVIAAVGVGAAVAQTDGARPLDPIYACADVADSAARLDCFDRAVAAVKQAQDTGRFTLLTPEDRREAERLNFGLAAPRPPEVALAAADPARPVQPAEELERLELTITATRADPLDKLVLTTADGQVWRQVDSESVRVKGKGPWKAEVRRAALKSYLMSLDGGRPFRVRREN